MTNLDNKVKHLEMIQAIINRFANNSFVLRGWSITVVSAITAIIAKDTGNKYFITVLIPIIVFWILDGYFLSRERRYRDFYDHVRTLSVKKIDFSMDTRPFKTGNNSWVNSMFSVVLLIFYGSLIGMVIFITTLYLNEKSLF